MTGIINIDYKKIGGSATVLLKPIGSNHAEQIKNSLAFAIRYIKKQMLK